MSRPRARLVDDSELRALLRAGWTVKEIQEHLKVSRATVYRAKKKLGLTKEQAKHELPWTIADEHRNTTPHQYLMVLSRKAQGLIDEEWRLNAAIQWARNAVHKGYDIGYSPTYTATDVSPFGGFRYVTADPESWFIKDLLEKAEAPRD